MGLMKEMLRPTFGGEWGYRGGEMVTTIQQHGDGDISVAYYQDPSRILKQNEIMRNEEGFDGYNKDRDLQHVAQVPLGVAMQWLHRYGVNIYDPSHHDAVLKLCDDPEYSKVKLVKGKVARKSSVARTVMVDVKSPPKIEVVKA